MKEKILELVNKYKAGYQPIIIKGETILPGWRECIDRWEIIKPFIKSQDVIMDLGSQLGYFGLKIEKEFPEALILSVEGNYGAAEIQKLVLEANESKNIYLINRILGLNDLLRISRTTEAINTILCLSMIYEFPKEQITNVLYLFSKIAPKLIIETCAPGEPYKGKEDIVKIPFEIVLRNFYKNVKVIGHSLSTQGVSRPIFYCDNEFIRREDLMPYFGGEHGAQIHKHVLEYRQSNWMLNGCLIMPGLNADNILMLNVTYPNSLRLILECAKAWHAIKHLGPTDISLKNNLVTSEGIKCFDYTELKGTNNVYGMTDKDYNNKVNNYSVEKITDRLTQVWKQRKEFL
jgi:hypothetical protein